EYPTNRVCRDSEEMRTVLPTHIALANHAHKRLVDEQCRLQRVTALLTAHRGLRNPVQLVVHDGREPIGGIAFARFEIMKYRGDVQCCSSGRSDGLWSVQAHTEFAPDCAAIRRAEKESSGTQTCVPESRLMKDCDTSDKAFCQRPASLWLRQGVHAHDAGRVACARVAVLRADGADQS